MFHSFRCLKALSHAEPLISLPWACLEANLILPNTSHLQTVRTPRSKNNLYRKHPSILAAKLFFLFSPNHVRFRRSAWHSEAVPKQKRQLLGNRIAPPERNGCTTMYMMMIASFSILPVFPKKIRKKIGRLDPAYGGLDRLVGGVAFHVQNLSRSCARKSLTFEETSTQTSFSISSSLSW